MPRPTRIPPANARNVTWMLFVKISAARSDCSSTDTPWSCPGVARLGDGLVLARHEAARGAGITPGPVAREQRRQGEERDRDQQERGTLAYPPPVPAGRELAHGVARPGRVVDRVTSAFGEPFEAPDDGIRREPAPREREIGRDRPITGAQAHNAVGSESCGRGATTLDELFELRPRRGSVAHELV